MLRSYTQALLTVGAKPQPRQPHEMGPTWVPHHALNGSHMGIPCGAHVEMSASPCGPHMGKLSDGTHLGIQWVPGGSQMGFRWVPCMNIQMGPPGNQVGTRWNQVGPRWESGEPRWESGGAQVGIRCDPYEYPHRSHI